MPLRKRYIENNILAFTHLATKVKFYNSLNLQDINIHLENTFRDIVNLMYEDRKFVNLNSVSNNFTALDLGDNKSELAFQITSTTSRLKVTETIRKYKTDSNYKIVVILYCVLEKPKRTNGFENLTDGKIIIEEWSLKDLVKKLSDFELNKLERISNLITKDILSNIHVNQKNDDNSAIEEWERTTPTDIRNITYKLKSVCSDIQQARITKYCRDIASGKIELSLHSERYVSAMKYRIFEVCQDELIEYYETRTDSQLSVSEINEILDKYTNRAFEIIEDKSKDYIYPLKNKDILKKIVLALIDECYLSFDEEGIYT